MIQKGDNWTLNILYKPHKIDYFNYCVCVKVSLNFNFFLCEITKN